MIASSYLLHSLRMLPRLLYASEKLGLISIALFYAITLVLEKQNTHIENFEFAKTYIIDEN